MINTTGTIKFIIIKWTHPSRVPDNIYDKDKQLIGFDYKNNNLRVRCDYRFHNILVRSDHYDNKTCYLQVFIDLIMLKN
jgi:hypothetical protein